MNHYFYLQWGGWAVSLQRQSPNFPKLKHSTAWRIFSFTQKETPFTRERQEIYHSFETDLSLYAKIYRTNHQCIQYCSILLISSAPRSFKNFSAFSLLCRGELPSGIHMANLWEVRSLSMIGGLIFGRPLK